MGSLLNGTDAKTVERVVRTFIVDTYLRSDLVLVELESVSVISQEPRRPHSGGGARRLEQVYGPGNNDTIQLPSVEEMTVKLDIRCRVPWNVHNADLNYSLVPSLLNGFNENYEIFLNSLSKASGTFRDQALSKLNPVVRLSVEQKQKQKQKGEDMSLILVQLIPGICLAVGGIILIALTSSLYLLSRRRPLKSWGENLSISSDMPSVNLGLATENINSEFAVWSKKNLDPLLIEDVESPKNIIRGGKAGSAAGHAFQNFDPTAPRVRAAVVLSPIAECKTPESILPPQHGEAEKHMSGGAVKPTLEEVMDDKQRQPQGTPQNQRQGDTKKQWDSQLPPQSSKYLPSDTNYSKPPEDTDTNVGIIADISSSWWK